MFSFASFASRPGLLLAAALGLCPHLAPAIEAGTASPAPAEVADPVVMTVNGEPVSAREYRLVMQRHRAAIYARFAKEKKREDQPGYWSPDSGPDGPLAQLRELVAAELVKIKVRQILGRQHGLVDDITFAAFLNQLATENTRRADALRTGQVIYGPQHYRLSAYYYTRLRDLEFRLQQIMTREFAGQITDAEIERHYAANPATLGKKPVAEVRLGIIETLGTQKAAAHLERLCAEAKVTTVAAELAQITPRSEAPAPAAAPLVSTP